MIGSASHESIIKTTTSLCVECKQGIPAEIVERENRVFMRKSCPAHGDQTILIASDADWYRDTLSFPADLQKPGIVRNKVEQGCPFDCGACPSHEQAVFLPVVPITSECNLDCPICYTINRNDDPYRMKLEEFADVLAVIKRNDPQLKIINFTGGEPTLHPQLLDIVRMCHQAGIHRITMSTHGLTFLKNEPLLARLAELGIRIVLSFDTFDDEVYAKMLAAKKFKAKMKILDLLDKYQVPTTLIPVVAKGVNDSELGEIVKLALERDCIRSLEIHTMTFTGQGGLAFDQDARITTPDVIRIIEETTGGLLGKGDFVPSPCAHPLCYQTSYLLRVGQDYVPFTRFMSREQIREMLQGNLYIEPGETMERVMTDVINALWYQDDGSPRTQEIMSTLKRNIQEMFPSSAISYAEQQRLAERAAKTIYIHSHMDDATFDTDRIRQCCVGVPAGDGGNIPTCAYNILYRPRDQRFSRKRTIPLAQLAGGYIPISLQVGG